MILITKKPKIKFNTNTSGTLRANLRDLGLKIISKGQVISD